jgi:hypothetical protein
MLLLNPHTLTFSFEVPEMLASEGVQKILGFSRGYHHWNSVRLGIRKENDYCVLYLYAYVRDERIVKRIGKVAVGSELKVLLRFGRHFASASYTNLINTEQSQWHYFAPQTTMPFGVLLNPYFETDAPENKVIPFDVKIWDVKINGKLIKI